MHRKIKARTLIKISHQVIEAEAAVEANQPVVQQPQGPNLDIQVLASTGTAETACSRTAVSECTPAMAVADATRATGVMHVLHQDTGETWNIKPQERHNLLTPMPPHFLTTVSPLNRAVWATHMAMHPDRLFATEIMTWIDLGVPTFYNGPAISQVYKNWNSCKQYSKEVSRIILAEVENGRRIGPFNYCPLAQYVGSPMGAIAKPSADGSTKYRIITDLSWPPTKSVNLHIGKEISSVDYTSVDVAASMIIESGQNCDQVKLDLADAYRQIVVRPEEWYLLGTTVEKEDGSLNYFIDTRLPFGLRSAAMSFSKFAKGLAYIMQNSGVKRCIQYLDDFYSCAPAATGECEVFKKLMLSACHDAGFAVNPKKVVGPVKVIEFLGIILDSTKMEMRMSSDRIAAIRSELILWRNKSHGSKRQLLSLLGKLVFLSRIIRPGRTFTRRLIECTKNIKFLHYKTRLSRAARDDIAWWLQCMSNWNSKSVFYDQFWTNAEDLGFKCDASNFGFGAVFLNKWIAGVFSEEERLLSIEWRELYAIVMACNCWGKFLTKKRFLIYSDNLSIVQSVNKGSSKSAPVMSLIRTLFFIACKNNFECRVRHISGVDNTEADLLSRGRIGSFHEHYPLFPTEMSTLKQLDVNDVLNT